MKNLKIAFSLCLLFATTSLCFGQWDRYKGEQTTQNRSVSNFESVSISHGMDLYITQTGSESLKLVAGDEVIDDILTEVKNGHLEIHVDGWNNRLGKVSVYLNVKELERIVASGGSDVDIESKFNADDIELNASGGSDLNVDNLSASTVDCTVSGGSDIDIEGTAKKIIVNASGGSDYNGRRMIADVARIQVSGGSDAEVHANDELKVNASGGSDVTYSGNPKIRDINAGRSSDVSSNN